jgi:hypothetical protein
MAAVLQLLQEQAVVSTGGQAEEEEIFAQDWEDTGFQASFSVLAASAAPVRDAAAPFAGADARVFLSQQLAALRRRDAAQVRKAGTMAMQAHGADPRLFPKGVAAARSRAARGARAILSVHGTAWRCLRGARTAWPGRGTDDRERQECH